MKWILLLICFVTTNNYNNFNPKLGTLTPMQNEIIQRDNERVVTSLRKLRTLTHMQSEIIQRDDERTLISLPLDNMPCVVPNMNLFRAMPNVGSIAILQNPVDPGIYIPKNRPRPLEKIKPS